MAYQSDQTIRTIYLRNHDLHAKLCRYSIDTGECIEIDRGNIVDDELWRGFYVSVEGKLVGIYASADGPVFFVDTKRYLWRREHATTTITELSAEKSIFTLRIDGEVKQEIEYTRPQYVGYDNWSTEEFVDFFVWLNNRQDSENFFSAYTISQ